MEEKRRTGGLRAIDVDPMARGVVVRDREKIQVRGVGDAGEIVYEHRAPAPAAVETVSIAVSRMDVEIAGEPARRGAKRRP